MIDGVWPILWTQSLSRIFSNGYMELAFILC
jgi:hypothetical protein